MPGNVLHSHAMLKNVNAAALYTCVLPPAKKARPYNEFLADGCLVIARHKSPLHQYTARALLLFYRVLVEFVQRAGGPRNAQEPDVSRKTSLQMEKALALNQRL